MPGPRRAAASCATRSMRCASSVSTPSCSRSPAAARSTRARCRRSAGCCGRAASTSSTPTTASPAGAPPWPAPRRWSSPSTAPTCAIGFPGAFRGASSAGSTSSPPSRERCSSPRRGARVCPRPSGRLAVLPCGADLERFRPIPRGERGRPWASRPTGATCCSRRAPGRAVKRHDRAVQVARLADAELLDRRRHRRRADAAVGERRERGPGPVRLRGIRARRR